MIENLEALASANAVCVVYRKDEMVGVICYQPPEGPIIRTYLPDAVDWRWSGPLLTTAKEVLAHLAQSEEPCSVPVELAQRLFNWTLPFAKLPV